MQHTLSLKNEEKKKTTSNKHFKVTIKDKRFVQHLLTSLDMTLKPTSLIFHFRLKVYIHQKQISLNGLNFYPFISLTHILIYMYAANVSFFLHNLLPQQGNLLQGIILSKENRGITVYCAVLICTACNTYFQFVFFFFRTDKSL